MPKVSIITPTYKGVKYITETIRSLQQQTFLDYEHIIINDNSPDDTEDIIKEYQKQDERIIYIKNSINLGIAGSRNVGIQHAQGTYICFLDHDDVFIDSEKLQQQYTFLEEHIDYDLVSTLIVTIDANGKYLYKNHGRETDQDIRNHLLQSNQFLPCALMIRKSSILKHGGFDSSYDKSDDYDLWMKIGRTGKMYCIQRYMTGYRVHENNTSGSIKALYHMRMLAWKIFWKNKSYYPNARKAFLLRIVEFIIPPSLIHNMLLLIKKTS